MPKLPPPLRRYQLEPFHAILRAAEAHDADILTVRMSRQAGKNEVSARAEGVLMVTNLGQSSAIGVKAAPTKTPQAERSLKRLAGFLRQCGMRAPTLRAGDEYVRLDRSEWWFGSGEPDANVVGATANLLLEFDEAQDFDLEKHDKDYAPMAASTACARVYWGTAWSDFDLLETMRLEALRRQTADGQQRVFDVTWDRVAEEVPAYGLFVESERDRLGHTPATPHLVFSTQYELKTMAGQGRWLSPAQLALLQGDHDPLDAPLTASHNVYVAGLDVAGADLSGSGDPDETVLTIGRASYPGRGKNSEPVTHAVRQYHWSGLDHDEARSEIVRLLRHWRVTHTAVDASGIGEPLANHLVNELGETAVTAFKFTRPSKSSLAFDFLSAINTGAFKVWRPDGAHHSGLLQQLQQARSEMKSGGFLDVFVDESDGHDDRLISAMLLNRAAQRGKPRIARQRTFRS